LETLRLEGQKQLESARQQHANYLERLKFDRAGLLDRAAKLNQREFEIIPDIWKNATEAHYAMLRLISRWQQCPDVGRMSEPRFEAFLEGSRLEAWQKEEIRALNRFERTTYYSDAEQWFRLQDANAAIVAFNRAAANGSIFLHPETHSKFEGFGDLMRNAFQRWSLNQQLKQDGDPIPKDEEDPVQMYREQGDPLYQGLSSYLRERYWISPQGEAI
ncbi:MAG TPA: hypothetical protein VLG14_15390, partial [Sphingomonas sp.]|nr:hypothetical protein [Sphingomonas sp.]